MAMSHANDRIIVITGSSRGLGKGLAEYFARNGWTVEGCSRGEFDIGIEGYTHSVIDTSDDKQVTHWVRSIKRRRRRIDVVVCNVGLVKSALLTPVIPVDLFDQFYRNSTRSTFLVCREAAKAMIMQRSGRIINIASTMTHFHEPGTAAYSSCKAGIIELTKVLARELVSYGVTCNVISPSLIDTPSSSLMGDDWKARMLDMQTIKRPVDASEVASMIEFFSRPSSSCLTGQVLSTCVVS
jgi:3-oxoacyl-[acyl-carrier protein] reductase